MDFVYLLEKIQNAEFVKEPFEHIVIENFLNDVHFDAIIGDKQIHFGKCDTNNQMRQKLKENHYAPISFPGCTINEKLYFESLKNNKWKNIHSDLGNEELEGFGIAYRLKITNNKLIKNLLNFMNSNRFKNALKSKFNIKNETYVLTKIQKYLTGYEISPHPDIRQKALTYLLNINQSAEFEHLAIHTQLLEFKNEYKHIYDIWENNTRQNRAWVPWRWCNTSKIVNKNNSIIIFKPSNKSLHAVKLKYDHLEGQRTQIYGNLMYKKPKSYKKQSHKYLQRKCNDYNAMIKEDEDKDGFDYVG